MFPLLGLGVTLSLDNCRMSIALGGLKPSLLEKSEKIKKKKKRKITQK